MSENNNNIEETNINETNINETNNISERKKMIIKVTVIGLALILFSAAIFLLVSYRPKTAEYPKLEDPTLMGVEKYKIVNTVMIPNEKDDHIQDVGFIVHLDDGRIKVIAVQQAARDPNLININEGYLYRINGQFYLRKD